MSSLSPLFSFEFPNQSGIDALNADVQAWVDLLKRDGDNQCLRRAYARSIFALVEGVVDHLKTLTYDFATHLLIPVRTALGPFHKQCPVPLVTDIPRPEELSLLLDKRIEVDHDGKTRDRSSYLDFKKNIRFAVLMYGRVFKVPIDVSIYTSGGWHRLGEGEKIRNRITHPKTKESLAISDHELLILNDGGQWMYDTYGRLLQEMKFDEAQQAFRVWLSAFPAEQARELVRFLRAVVSTA